MFLVIWCKPSLTELNPEYSLKAANLRHPAHLGRMIFSKKKINKKMSPCMLTTFHFTPCLHFWWLPVNSIRSVQLYGPRFFRFVLTHNVSSSTLSHYCTSSQTYTHFSMLTLSLSCTTPLLCYHGKWLNFGVVLSLSNFTLGCTRVEFIRAPLF